MITRGLPARSECVGSTWLFPEESLFLTKSTGKVTHTGGKLFGEDSVYYKTLLEWLKAGAPADPTPPPKVSKLEVYPPQSVIEGEGSTQEFIAVAHYSDGTTRDVTNLSAFMTNNETSAAIDKDGMVTAGARGEAFVMARFETKTEGRQVLVLPKDLKYQAPGDHRQLHRSAGGKEAEPTANSPQRALHG